MKRGIIAFIAGIATAAGLSAIFRERIAGSRFMSLDLNRASAESLINLGLDSDSADRIIENRPYRNKLELLERFVVPQADYDLIKQRIRTDTAHANDPVRVAS
jgi:hypothetical protein